MLPNPNWTDKQHLTGLSKLSGKCAVPCWEPADLYSLSVFSLLLFRFTARHGAPAPRPEEHVTLSVCYTAENRAAEWKMNWTTQSTAAASYLGWEKWNWKYSSLQSSACLCCWLANRGRKWVKQIIDDQEIHMCTVENQTSVNGYTKTEVSIKSLLFSFLPHLETTTTYNFLSWLVHVWLTWPTVKTPLLKTTVTFFKLKSN